MSDVDIVRLGSSDGALQALYADAFEDESRSRGRLPDAAYVRRVLANELTSVLAAVKNDVIVGALTAYDLQKLEQAQSDIYIYDLAVDGGHCRQGGAALSIDAACVIGRADSAGVANVQTDREVAPAIALYGKRGRREDVVHFDLSTT